MKALIHFATALSDGDLRHRYEILKELYKENNLPPFVIPEAMFTFCSTTTEANPTPATPANPTTANDSTPTASQPISTSAEPSTVIAPEPKVTTSIAAPKMFNPYTTVASFVEENSDPRMQEFHVPLRDPVYGHEDGDGFVLSEYDQESISPVSLEGLQSPRRFLIHDPKDTEEPLSILDVEAGTITKKHRNGEETVTRVVTHMKTLMYNSVWRAAREELNEYKLATRPTPSPSTPTDQTTRKRTRKSNQPSFSTRPARRIAVPPTGSESSSCTLRLPSLAPSLRLILKDPVAMSSFQSSSNDTSGCQAARAPFCTYHQLPAMTLLTIELTAILTQLTTIVLHRPNQANRYNPAPPNQTNRYSPAPPNQANRYSPAPPNQANRYSPAPPNQANRYSPAPLAHNQPRAATHNQRRLSPARAPATRPTVHVRFATTENHNTDGHCDSRMANSATAFMNNTDQTYGHPEQTYGHPEQTYGDPEQTYDSQLGEGIAEITQELESTSSKKPLCMAYMTNLSYAHYVPNLSGVSGGMTAVLGEDDS
ncbi:uncharacterized protein [Procambarus clarkii]|uniref:uncharacterized protein n=1 Tax=Procambarus clarkii TaxID=6728 RepID=UPI0037424F2D